MDREGDAVELETVKQTRTLKIYLIIFYASHFILFWKSIKARFRQKRKNMKSHKNMSLRNQVSHQKIFEIFFEFLFGILFERNFQSKFMVVKWVKTAVESPYQEI